MGGAWLVSPIPAEVGLGWCDAAGEGGVGNCALPQLQPPPHGPRAAFQSPDYQTKKLETKTLRNKLFHIKRMVSDYDKVRG